MSYEACLAAVDRAAQAEGRGDIDAAINAYGDAVETLMHWMQREPDAKKRVPLKQHISTCLTRAEKLKRNRLLKAAAEAERESRAFERQSDYSSAKQKCLDAAETLLKLRETEDKGQKDVLAALTEKINGLLSHADLLEQLSGVPAIPKDEVQMSEEALRKFREAPSTDVKFRKPEQGQASQQQHNKATQEELAFLRESSVACGTKLPMWDDPREGYRAIYPNLRSPSPYTDPSPPQLSPKQREHGGHWMRPEQFLPEGVPPKVIGDDVDPLDIMQSVVGNCSYVCSLTVAAAYEQRFPHVKLITSAIFPQDTGGNPVINPSGKYAIKLLANGIVRMVIIDDRIVAAKGQGWIGGPRGGHAVQVQGHSPLCGHCASGDLWVSLYEKAFLKVFGSSYEFAGSNSSTDLYHLCGWIPETLDLTQEGFNKPAEWQRLAGAHQKGLVMVTVGTAPRGKMPALWEEKLGLVAGHAYSVLDFKEADGVCLLKMMNPWRQHRWKGRYSHQDNRNWTPSLQMKLHYNRKQEDNGVFWIDWNDAVKFFDRMNLSWMPHSFSYRFARHLNWKNAIPENNHFFRCPQYCLSIQAPAQTAVWILLVRHLLAQKEEELPFITLHAFKTTGLVDNLRVALPFSLEQSRVVHEGVYRNASMKLLRLTAPPGLSKHTLVVSSLTARPIPHSLTVYSPLQSLSIERLPDIPHPHVKALKGEWTKDTAGGRAGLPGWKTNPQFRIVVKEQAPFVVTLELAKQISVGMTVSSVSKEELAEQGTGWQGRVESVSSITFRSGNFGKAFACINTAHPTPGHADASPGNVAPGVYTMVPTTYDPGEQSAFRLTIYSPSPAVSASLTQLPPEGHGMKHHVFKGDIIKGGVVHRISGFTHVTARLVVENPANHLLTARFSIELWGGGEERALKASSKGMSEYLIPFSGLSPPPTSSAPALLKVSLPDGQLPASYTIHCYTDVEVRVL